MRSSLTALVNLCATWAAFLVLASSLVWLVESDRLYVGWLKANSVFAAESPVRLHPKYECAGTSPSGKRYQLTLTVVDQGATMELTWQAAGQTAFVGFGVRKGDTIAAVYADGKQVSVVLYEIRGGQLLGWGPAGEGKLTLETCLAGKPV